MSHLFKIIDENGEKNNKEIKSFYSQSDHSISQYEILSKTIDQ